VRPSALLVDLDLRRSPYFFSSSHVFFEVKNVAFLLLGTSRPTVLKTVSPGKGTFFFVFFLSLSCLRKRMSTAQVALALSAGCSGDLGACFVHPFPVIFPPGLTL